MATQFAEMACSLYKSAFSGEVVFAVAMFGGGVYEGISPKHYATIETELSTEPTPGFVKVRVIRNGGEKALVLMPDGEAIEIPVATVNAPA